MNDDQLLAGIPGYLSIDCMLKATPSVEGQDRFVYIEASSEGRDQQNEIVLAKALEESVGHFLKFGNLDLDHKTVPSIAARYGITNPQEWEIGVPVEARVDGTATFVKARLYSGDTPLAAQANMVWDSMTKLTPPKRWYPSVGGQPLAKSIRLDPETGDKVGVISKVRWTNLALTAHPVNQHVPGVSTAPFGVLAKSWCHDGFVVTKALEASYATDAAAKTGGAALGMQSIDTTPHSYFDFREQMASVLRARRLRDQSAAGLVQYSINKFSLSAEEAEEWVDRFLSDLKSGLSRSQK